MSNLDNIIQIMPAAGWVAVYDEGGEESAQAIVCFALVESEAGGTRRRSVRPLCADGKAIVLADEAPNFLRVEELATFEEDEEEDEEDEEEEDEE
ncbi:hypothetical protein RKE25_14930 [Dyella sp. BiH032]|uniref:hypothetical protein n=1 Tax=Dyella sp. BiH032 TaxID=3075430 RepID=UPI002893253D|nr:hypothetical protein [Dyella sp. BiH032]WNL44711.1 hypothetical protein RKE25_14930 [Dyella sp. BiH032]